MKSALLVAFGVSYQRELETLESLFSVTILDDFSDIKKAASVLSMDYDIIHIATHGSHERMYLRKSKIFPLELGLIISKSTELVFLNACDSVSFSEQVETNIISWAVEVPEKVAQDYADAFYFLYSFSNKAKESKRAADEIIKDEYPNQKMPIGKFVTRQDPVGDNISINIYGSVNKVTGKEQQ